MPVVGDKIPPRHGGDLKRKINKAYEEQSAKGMVSAVTEEVSLQEIQSNLLFTKYQE